MASATKNSKNIYAFDPRSLPGCLLWLDGSDSTTITLSGSSVTQWRDKSKYDNHAIASGLTSSSLPTKGTVNGLSSIYFTNGPYTVLKTAPNLLSNNVSNNLTYFFVIRPTIDSPASKFFSSYDGTRKLGLVGSVPTYLYQYSGATPASNTLPILGKNPIVCSIVENSGTMQTYVNGVANATTSATTAITVVTPLYIGSDTVVGTNFYGDICEILFYTSVLSTDQRQTVEAYLSQKWRTYIATDQSQIGTNPYLQYDFSTSNTITAFAGGTDSAATNFSYTGGDQYYTVPANCYFLKVTLIGAGGGRPYTASGVPGAGGTVVGVLPTTPGASYTIVAGGGGGISGNNAAVSPGGYGYGGQGGTGSPYNNTGGGGGGRTAIVDATGDVVTAGSGGGSAGNNQNGNSVGGNGGGLNGGSGGGAGGSNPSTGGTGTAGQGYAGGNVSGFNSTPSGGGGAGGAAPTTYMNAYANEGGPPAYSYITGKYEQYGRGGNGWLSTYAYTVPRVNRGDGGNGSTISSATVSAGASGVVIIRFVTA
jgi:hypothetical protein